MKDPATHRCPLEELDYSQVQEGIIVCTGCGRTWHRFPQGPWVVRPLTVRPWR